jgi:hypothetical protein
MDRMAKYDLNIKCVEYISWKMFVEDHYRGGVITKVD